MRLGPCLDSAGIREAVTQAYEHWGRKLTLDAYIDIQLERIRRGDGLLHFVGVDHF